MCARVRDVVYEPPVLMCVAEATSRIGFPSSVVLELIGVRLCVAKATKSIIRYGATRALSSALVVK